MPRQSPEVRAGGGATRARPDRRRPAYLPPDAPPDSAAVIASQLVGALQLARALGDNAEGKALLAATRRSAARAVRHHRFALIHEPLPTLQALAFTFAQKYDDHHIIEPTPRTTSNRKGTES